MFDVFQTDKQAIKFRLEKGEKSVKTKENKLQRGILFTTLLAGLLAALLSTHFMEDF